MKHLIRFVCKENQETEFVGYETQFGDKGDSFGQGGFDSMMFVHDIIEHGFEHSEIFNTDFTLSVEGEFFALGIRTYMDTHMNFDYHKYIGFNKDMGVYGNTRSSLKGFIQEDPEHRQYPFAGEFTAKYYTGFYDSDFLYEFKDLIEEDEYGVAIPCIKAYSAGYETAETLWEGNDFVVEKICKWIVQFTENFNQPYFYQLPENGWAVMDLPLSFTFEWDENHVLTSVRILLDYHNYYTEQIEEFVTVVDGDMEQDFSPFWWEEESMNALTDDLKEYYELN